MISASYDCMLLSTRRSLLKGDAVFYVPEVIADLTTKEVLTSELVSGVTLDRLVTADQQTRNWVRRQWQ